MFATKIPNTKSASIENRAVFNPPFTSEASEETAQRLLSTVEISPLTTMNKNGTMNHAGKILRISSKFTKPASAATNPLPPATSPMIPIDNGTSPKSNAP